MNYFEISATQLLAVSASIFEEFQKRNIPLSQLDSFTVRFRPVSSSGEITFDLFGGFKK